MFDYFLEEDPKTGAVKFWTDDPELHKDVMEHVELLIDAHRYRRDLESRTKNIKIPTMDFIEAETKEKSR